MPASYPHGPKADVSQALARRARLCFLLEKPSNVCMDAEITEQRIEADRIDRAGAD
jgi:hypothetical protein